MLTGSINCQSFSSTIKFQIQRVVPGFKNESEFFKMHINISFKFIALASFQKTILDTFNYCTGMLSKRKKVFVLRHENFLQCAHLFKILPCKPKNNFLENTTASSLKVPRRLKNFQTFAIFFGKNLFLHVFSLIILFKC